MRASLTVLWLAALCSQCHCFDSTILYEAFTSVFPLKDGSHLLLDETVFIEEALRHLDLLQVPHTKAEFCALDEARIATVIMKASLGNLVQDEDPLARDKLRQPYQANPLTGKIEYVNNYTSNRLMIFEVLIYSLLLALARSWYVMDQSAK